MNLVDRPYFQQTYRNCEFAIGDYQIGRITGKPSINFGYSVLDENGQVKKVVFAALYLSQLNQRSRSMTRDAFWYMRPIVEEMASVFQDALPEGIRFEAEIEAGEHTINADPTRIRQVLMNLVTNARDAMPEGGDLKIGLGIIQVLPDEAPPVVSMSVGQWVCLYRIPALVFHRTLWLIFLNLSSPPRLPAKGQDWGLPRCMAS